MVTLDCPRCGNALYPKRGTVVARCRCGAGVVVEELPEASELIGLMSQEEAQCLRGG